MSADSGGSQAAAKGAFIGALGVVFGDIGTSPIYTVQTVFNPSDPHPVKVTPDTLFGIISMIVWSVVLIVTVTYVLLVMHADNDGEGGIMALITLIRGKRGSGPRRATVVLAALGIFGASLFFGDSMITPAISVLSAVEGLKVPAPSVANLVVPITAAIIVVLFLFQRKGTSTVGRFFGPVMIVWFAAIAACGVRGIAQRPEILKALSPTYAIGFFFGHFAIAFFALAAVVLAVTGAEALYADLGHFGRAPITRAWLMIVFPACILSYLGQGALILGSPSTAIGSPFFKLVPSWGQYPLVFLATAATVIASQAVITGAFSVAHQAVQLGYLPALRVRHTSEEKIGQIYIPLINWILMVSVLALVFAFQTSAALAFAFGMAVTGTITITTLLFFYIVRYQWGKPLWIVAFGAGTLLTVDLLFLGANATKIAHGAWLPLVIAITTFTILMTWQRGRGLVTAAREREEGPLRTFVDELHRKKHPVDRVRGTAVFLNRNNVLVPLAMRQSVQHFHALHEHVVILTIELSGAPHVPAAERIEVNTLGYADDGITHVSARYGYKDHYDVPAVLRAIDPAAIECALEVDEASYFLSKIELRIGHTPGLARWRKRLFIATSRIAADPAVYFQLPRERTIILSMEIGV